MPHFAKRRLLKAAHRRENRRPPTASSHRLTTTTMTPASSGNYAQGRATLKFYQQGFVNIDAFNDAYTRSMQNARLSDKEIEDLIERMNLTPR